MEKKVDKIIVETYSSGFSKKYDLSSITINEPECSKITLVIDNTNVLLYEGREFKNCVS